MSGSEEFKGFLYHFEKTAETFLKSLEEVRRHLLDLDKRLTTVEESIRNDKEDGRGRDGEVGELQKSFTAIDKEFSNFKTQILVYMALGGLIFGAAITAFVSWAVSSLLKHGG